MRCVVVSEFVEPITPSRIKRSGCRFELPTWSGWRTILLELFFTAGAIMLWTAAAKRPTNWFFLLFTAFWTIVGPVSLAWELLYGAFGSEGVAAQTGSLSIRREFSGLVIHNRVYQEAEVRHLRVQVTGGGRGSISRAVAFDYGAKTITFGHALSESEMYELVDLLSDCSPAIMKNRAGSTSSSVQTLFG